MWLHVDSDHDARMNVFSSLQDAVLAARMSTGVSLWYSKLSMTKALIGAFEDGFNTYGGCYRTPSCLVLASLI